MTGHYYTQKPTVSSNEKEVDAELLGLSLQYITDQGVFSKGGVDFGSQLLIETFYSDWIRTNQGTGSVLDLGCGYGAMGLALAKACPNTHVTMVDINERAVGLARKNAQRLKLGNVTIIESDGLEEIRTSTFDRILTNPPIRAGKQLIHQWFEDGRELLNDDGQLWIVIQKKQGAPSAWRKLEECYASVKEAAREKGYYIYFAAK